MAARSAAVLPRFLLIALACLLASAAVTFAADSTTSTQEPAAAPEPAGPDVLVVPDVTQQAYVFAKGALADAGFAWKVAGSVEGFAANVVASQSPAAGTRLVDTGAPLVTLELSKNGTYAEKGEPQNASPYAGTELRLAPLAEADAEPAAPAVKPKPAAKAPAEKQPVKKKQQQPAAAASGRAPAFAAPGAPPEPLDEMPLHERAKLLSKWLDTHRKPTDANVRHWLYQHNWIVTGASFGWSHGEDALELLIAVDRRVEKLWGVGTKSRKTAERALVRVRAASR